ncbi:unnamed protein product [Urochloa decumbens]|uniref:Uncharacterized protein n=1 Tax=Urochloa decumbens TaxID=240449 RepID=A0ABC8ZL74_9POAL
MAKKYDVLYNNKVRRSQSTICKPRPVSENTTSCSHPLSSNPAPSATHRDASKTVKYHVSKSEILNYEAICRLAFSQYQGEDAVYLYGVRCTFWSLGESLKPDGQVHSFVVSVFCYSLFLKPIRHCDVSKRYYFFSNIADNLLKNFDEADEDVLSQAFKRLSKTRSVTHSNTRASFEYHGQKILEVDIGFEDFQLIYHVVPRQPPGHENDSGIYAMMFLEHWLPNTNSLSYLF